MNLMSLETVHLSFMPIDQSALRIGYVKGSQQCVPQSARCRSRLLGERVWRQGLEMR